MPDADRTTSEAQVLNALRKVFESARAHYREVERRAGLPAAPLRALAEVARQPGLSSAQLASALGVRPATASNLLKPLEAGGLVEKIREARDQRIVRLKVTAKGTRLVASSGAGGLLSLAIAQIAEPELNSLLAGLRALTAKLPESRARRPAPSLALSATRRRRRSSHAR